MIEACIAQIRNCEGFVSSGDYGSYVEGKVERVEAVPNVGLQLYVGNSTVKWRMPYAKALQIAAAM